MRAARDLAREFVRAHPADAAPILEELPVELASAVLAELPPATAAGCLASLVAMSGADCLARIPASRAGMILGELPADAATVLLLRSSPEVRERLLAEAPAEAAESLARRLRFREGTAGALADSRLLSVPDQITAGEALSRVRKSPGMARYYLYAVDRDERLVGVVTHRELLLAPPKAALASVMTSPVASIPATDDGAAVLANPAWRRFHQLPVVDGEGRLLGFVDHETVKRLELDRSGPGASRPVSVGLAFADLCWVGMTRVVGAVAAAAAGPNSTSGDRND